jgi:tetratricopeptide (TPR) repeat protein
MKAMLPVFAVILLSGVLSAQTGTPHTSNDALELVKEGEKLNSEGKQDEALARYQKALEKSPNLFEAQLESGVALDLKGNYDEARKHLSKAINVASAEQKQQAQRAMAMSYVFEGNVKEAQKYEKQAFDAVMSKQDFIGAAGVANELARVLLESGDVDGAQRWYKRGYETALRKSDLKDTEKSLWEFRWAHAQARIAARRGQKEEAQNQVAAAKAALDKANDPDQAIFYPYLVGYVAFYSGNYKTAIAELEKASQRDPFILTLLAQAHEKSGDQARALEYYRKVMASNGHGPTNAFARPLARKKLAGA